MQSLEAKKKWQTVINPEELGKLSVDERLQMIEAIEQTLGEEYWEKLEALAGEGDTITVNEEDIQLAKESLEEYKNNPKTGVSWDEFYANEAERLSRPK